MYQNKPIIERQLFDKATVATIQRFMDEWLPLTPVESESKETPTPHRFRRRYGHNVPFFVGIHNQLTDFASEMFGEKVKPSYSFLSLYNEGGTCPLHLDRPQCRYTIDYLIRQEMSEPWPIAIGTQMTNDQRELITDSSASYMADDDDEIETIIEETEWTRCLLKPNDAVCYSGTHSWHYRPTVSTGTVDLVFFHFVPRNFDGSLN